MHYCIGQHVVEGLVLFLQKEVKNIPQSQNGQFGTHLHQPAAVQPWWSYLVYCHWIGLWEELELLLLEKEEESEDMDMGGLFD